jgi:hypothetical protein
MLTPFQQELILVILDKLLIGLLIGIAAYIANRSIERYRHRQAYVEFAARKRLEAIGEAWLKLYKLDSLYWKSINEVVSLRDKKDLSNEIISSTISEQTRAIKDDELKILEYLSENRFWLGKDAHQRYVSYVFALGELINKFSDGTTIDIASAHSKLNSLREDVLEAVESKYI